jgi:hypothetical protein
VAIKKRDWCEKSGIFLKSYKLIAIPFNILSPTIYTLLLSFVQSSAAGHQLSPYSAGLPFFILPHPQTEN